jgi:hypothetical protein
MGIHQVGKTDANGRFECDSILTGTYYAFATLEGYASPASLLPRLSLFGVPTHLSVPSHTLDAVLPRVEIKEQAASVIDFELAIGGSLSGRVTWQNGAPAKHHEVCLQLVDTDGHRHDHPTIPLEDERLLHQTPAETDADGQFRFEGLYTGRYIVGARAHHLLPYIRKNADLSKGTPTINWGSFFLWNGAKPYHMEAIPFELETGMVISGIDLVLPMPKQKPIERS